MERFITKEEKIKTIFIPEIMQGIRKLVLTPSHNYDGKFNVMAYTEEELDLNEDALLVTKEILQKYYDNDAVHYRENVELFLKYL